MPHDLKPLPSIEATTPAEYRERLEEWRDRFPAPILDMRAEEKSPTYQVMAALYHLGQESHPPQIREQHLHTLRDQHARLVAARSAPATAQP